MPKARRYFRRLASKKRWIFRFVRQPISTRLELLFLIEWKERIVNRLERCVRYLCGKASISTPVPTYWKRKPSRHEESSSRAG